MTTASKPLTREEIARLQTLTAASVRPNHRMFCTCDKCSAANKASADLIEALDPVIPDLLAAARQYLELCDMLVFDVRDNYTRRTIGLSDAEILEKWRAGVLGRGWSSGQGGNDG